LAPPFPIANMHLRLLSLLLAYPMASAFQPGPWRPVRPMRFQAGTTSSGPLPQRWSPKAAKAAAASEADRQLDLLDALLDAVYDSGSDVKTPLGAKEAPAPTPAPANADVQKIQPPSPQPPASQDSAEESRALLAMKTVVTQRATSPQRADALARLLIRFLYAAGITGLSYWTGSACYSLWEAVKALQSFNPSSVIALSQLPMAVCSVSLLMLMALDFAPNAVKQERRLGKVSLRQSEVSKYASVVRSKNLAELLVIGAIGATGQIFEGAIVLLLVHLCFFANTSVYLEDGQLKPIPNVTKSVLLGFDVVLLGLVAAAAYSGTPQISVTASLCFLGFSASAVWQRLSRVQRVQRTMTWFDSLYTSVYDGALVVSSRFDEETATKQFKQIA